MMFATLLEKLRHHEDLTSDEAAWAMGVIMDGQAQSAHRPGRDDGDRAPGVVVHDCPKEASVAMSITKR